MRENGDSWKEAIKDGWVPGKNLFGIDEAISKGTIIMNLLSDAAQSKTWPDIKPKLTKGKTLYFSHGFSPVFKDLTKVDVPPDIDVILVAPKGSGKTVRILFENGLLLCLGLFTFPRLTSTRSRYQLFHRHLAGCDRKGQGEGYWPWCCYRYIMISQGISSHPL